VQGGLGDSPGFMIGLLSYTLQTSSQELAKWSLNLILNQEIILSRLILDPTMIKIQPLLALSCSLTAIVVAISPLAAFANDSSRSGTDDDSIKPIRPQVQRSGTNDDGIKPLFPKLQPLSLPNRILKTVVPKQPLPAKKTKTGQTDESI
jgi:hypothetical protein